jgi:hypothetical protein
MCWQFHLYTSRDFEIERVVRGFARDELLLKRCRQVEKQIEY